MLLKKIEQIYGYFVEKRNAEFDAGKLEVMTIEYPVISVGNVSAGGTGKSPFVQLVAREFLKHSIAPAIVSRGYRRKSRGEVVVCDGLQILAGVEQAGDELMMHAESLGVVVIANENKGSAAQKAVEIFKERDDEARQRFTSKEDYALNTVPRCIIIDDGFQHRKIHRDLDIVLIDHATLQNPFLLPRGRLREPLDSLKRADVIVLMNGAQRFTLKKHVQENLLKENCVIIEAQTVAGEFYDINSRQTFKINPFRSGCVAISTIAQPERFIKTLEGREIEVHHHFAFKDHYWFSEGDIKKIIQKCELLQTNVIATTEKDAVKLRKFKDLFNSFKVSVAVLPIRIEISEGRDEFLKKLTEIF
ncbi:MAG TPA: tetraacyldisaccharide 4'-kinase [Patescibacteria group bacterium]|nr:tetraacyldisaccharide 4'-kinase [Patescibacteria group bacterium]